MRAIYLDTSFNEQDRIELIGSEAHHLINVLRVKEKRSLLALNGRGVTAEILIEELGRRSVVLSIKSVIEHKKKHHIDLFIGKLKKDAMDLVLKQACEVGIRNIYLVNTEYSQRYDIKEERTKKLLIAGIEQSNNPFLPKIIECDFEAIQELKHDVKMYFSLKQNLRQESCFEKDILLIIGPEGGLSKEEEASLQNVPSIETVNFPSYILRAPTAFACASGYALSKITNIDAL